jgi:hypothetical protein
VRERGQIDTVRSATCVGKDDKRMAMRPNGRYRREADIVGPSPNRTEAVIITR